MKVNLLYSQKDFTGTEGYFDWNSIVQDLGLDTLFAAGAADVVWKNGKVMYVQREDEYLKETLKRVMRVPLKNREEILYRQAVLKDCVAAETMMNALYEKSGEFLDARRNLEQRSGNARTKDNVGSLITEIEVMRLTVKNLTAVRKLLCEWEKDVVSEGFFSLRERLLEEFSEEKEKQVQKILEDISFYVDILEERVDRNTMQTKYPHFVITAGLGEDLKFTDLKLEKLFTETKRYNDTFGTLFQKQTPREGSAKERISLQKNASVMEQGRQLEYNTVKYVTECLNTYLNGFSQFFDQLHLQIGFYRAAFNLMHQMERYAVGYCFPEPREGKCLNFSNLKELVMRMEQKNEVVANSCVLDGKELLIVTGANQGGKSTFLRSIGIAQVMMQSGLPVPAEQFSGGVYPDFFTHFTRREDSAMNRGRLDEELRRMDQILKHLGTAPMLLMNESFASTTELEGSDIAYDIVKALKEQGVKILTVTHLLSFAKKMYEENHADAKSGVEFLSAERLSDGSRTFKMVQHEPELTSFGLDLYEQIVEKQGKENSEKGKAK